MWNAADDLVAPQRTYCVLRLEPIQGSACDAKARFEALKEDDE